MQLLSRWIVQLYNGEARQGPLDLPHKEKFFSSGNIGGGHAGHKKVKVHPQLPHPPQRPETRQPDAWSRPRHTVPRRLRHGNALQEGRLPRDQGAARGNPGHEKVQLS